MPYNTKSLKRDVNNLAVPQAFNITYDDYEVITSRDGCMHVSTVQKAYRYDFPGSALDSNEFTIVQTGSGHTVTVTSSELRIATGTTASTETIIRSTKSFKIPFRVFAILYLSQRIANQEFYIEVVNAAGDMKAYWLFDGTTNTSAKYNCMNKTNTQSDSTQSSLPASSSYSIYEIELYPDETYFFNRSVDSTSTRGTSAVRTRFLPDPNEDYYIQIRAKNLGTAPASSTTFYIDAIAVQDISELTAEITGGRGSIVGSQSIPVALTNTISINSPSVFYSNSLSIDTTTTLSASTAYTGSSKDCGSPLTSSLIRICVGHAGATPNIGHLELQQSADNSTFRTTHKIPIPNDGQFRVFDFPIAMRYLKIVFTNGAVAQTTFGVYSALIRDTNHATNEGTLMIPQTSTALTASATYTGFTMELGGTINATSFAAYVYADQAGTLYLEQSRDSSTWRVTATQAVTAGNSYAIQTPIIGRYVRARYVNGATAQGAFDLNTSIIF